MKKALLLLTGTLLLASAFSQVRTRSYIVDPALAPREHNVDFQHMRLDVSFEPSKGLVKGKVTHIFKPLQPKVDSIFLDGPGITIKEVSVNGKTAKFRTVPQGVIVYTPSLAWETRDSMTLVYEATPRAGLYFVGWNDPNGISRKQIWTQGQGIDNRHWIPMYDEMNDKMTTETIVRFDKEYKVLSNGAKLREKDNKDGTVTWHYKMKNPHAPYLVMLAIGKYDIKESRSASGVPMRMYYYPEWKERVEPTYRYSEEIMNWFEKEIGVPYPWESYSQVPVQEFMYGAMENTTATIFGDFFLVDERSYNDRNYVGVNAHELAHQWFGDCITARSSAHHWLQESFATYYNQMYEREVFGQDYSDWTRRLANINALEESKKNKLGVGHSEGGTVRHYPKGAYVLNMLKYVAGGREPYNKAIKHYLEKHKYGNVDSKDLLVAFHETLGYSLDWFWEEWVYRGGEPSFKVGFSQGGDAATFTVEQVHETSPVVGLPESGANSSASHDPFVPQQSSEYQPAGLFRMPVWFEVHYTDGTSERKMVWIKDQHHTVSIPVTGKKIDYVLFDPNSEVMKEVSFDKPFEMLRSQALRAKHMLDRYDALAAMRAIPLARKRETLLQAYAKETFHATKGEIVAQLLGDTDPKSRDVVKAAISDKDPQVHKAVVASIKTIPADLAAEFEKLLQSPSYEVVASALEKLSTDHPANTVRYLEATKGVTGTVGRNVEIKWLEVSASLTGERKHVDQLIAYSSGSYEFRTRVNAMNALKRLGHFDSKFLDNIVEAMLSANGRLSGPAGDVIRYYYEQNAYRKIIDEHLASRRFEGWQKEAIGRFITI